VKVGSERRRVEDRRAGIERRRGRRRLSDGDTVQTSLRLPAALLDRLCQSAIRHRQGVAERHRWLLEQALTAEGANNASRI
jgi:hypothetical protein